MARLRGLLFLLLLLSLPLPVPPAVPRPYPGTGQARPEQRPARVSVADVRARAEHSPASGPEVHANRPDAGEIEALIHQLGNDLFTEREAATRRLEGIGEPALADLQRATRESADPEIRHRAEGLVTRIENRDIDPRFDKAVAAVRAILPPGWRVARTRAETTPPDWHTDDPKAGFLIEGGNGTDLFRIWFLPPDWIGIRKLENQAPLTRCGEGILAGEKYKTIALGPDALLKRVDDLFGRGMSTPSLVNGGYSWAMKVFEGREREADRAAVDLIAKHCRTPAEFAEAAHSLIVLGVPAKTVFLRAAREVRGFNADFFYDALGLLGGSEAVGVLCDIVADASLKDHARMYAVMALDRHHDERIGPALHAALKQMANGEALDHVARGLAHLRYEPAAPDLLARFQKMGIGDYAKGSLAQALAALRYQKAVPEFRRVLAELPEQKGPGLRESVELALLRLTGDWGGPSDALRLHAVSPAKPVLGEKMELTIYVENVGREPLSTLTFYRPEDGLIIDGQPLLPEPIFVFNGSFSSFDPGEVHTISYDLAPHIMEPGEHTIQYLACGAQSNVATFTVQPAKP